MYAIRFNDEQPCNDTYTDDYSFGFSLFQVLLSFLAVGLMQVLIFRKFKNVEKPEQKYAKIWTLFDSLKMQKQPLEYFTYFIVRRWLLATVVIFFTDMIALQLYAFLILSILQQIYLIYYLPFESKLLCYIEIFNEMILYSVIIIMMLFSDYIEDASLKYYIGWIFCSLLVFQIIVNLSVIIYKTIKQIWLHLRLLKKMIRIRMRKMTKIENSR